MKKLISIVMVICIVFAFSAQAFAAPERGDPCPYCSNNTLTKTTNNLGSFPTGNYKQCPNNVIYNDTGYKTTYQVTYKCSKCGYSYSEPPYQSSETFKHEHP